jgi:acetyl esterase/lipase
MKFIFILLIPFIILSCKKEKKITDPIPVVSDSNNENLDPSKSYDLKNVSYGSDTQQVMDIYLPANRNSNSTKVFFLIHGGGWSQGSKADFEYVIPALKIKFPNCAIVNLGYRLATIDSPGYPKQINDIQQAINKLENNNYQLAKKYALWGSSAGAHLAMLYSYKFDVLNHVKVVCNSVGPADFTDSSYVNNPMYQYALFSLVGNQTYQNNPALYSEVSPVKHIHANAPKTISFYGDSDPLIPATQGEILNSTLNQFNIYNEFYLYQGEGHGNWNSTNSAHYQQKLIAFLTNHFL